jgi:hypothetical protein
MTLNARYNAAIDAVKLADGSIVCRNEVARASGCVPLNIIGNVPVSAAAWGYVAPENGPQQHTRQQQDVGSFNINGEVFETWAGPVALATGAEWRRESYRVNGDPYGNGIFADSPNTAQYPADPILNSTVGNNWYAGNYHNAAGTYNVKEAYAELNLPVLKSATWGEANINIADRHTKYSTSGHVESWKLGANWKTGIDGLRLRAVTSKDVRAPNLSELYAARWWSTTSSSTRATPSPSSSAPSATPSCVLRSPATTSSASCWIVQAGRRASAHRSTTSTSRSMA